MQKTQVVLDFPFPEERVFRYQAMQDILHHLLNNPFEELTQQELASITGSDVSSVSRSLDLLEQLGVVDVSEDRPARIALDEDHLRRPEPVFAIPQSEFRKPIQAYLDRLETRLEETGAVEEVVAVVLFGSVARGEADRRSDIDLLVIADGEHTHGRRVCASLARDIEEQSFDGHRYEFEVLVETPETAVSHGEELQEIFDQGLVLDSSDQLKALRQKIYASGEAGE